MCRTIQSHFVHTTIISSTLVNLSFNCETQIIQSFPKAIQYSKNQICCPNTHLALLQASPIPFFNISHKHLYIIAAVQHLTTSNCLLGVNSNNMKHSGNLLKRSTCEAAEVRFVRFCTLSKAELESWSVAEITESRIYEGTHPVRGGPNDLRLGVNSLEFPCDTCGETRDCQGHFGHIKLVQPVFHYGFMEYVEKILKCICHHCSKLKLFTTEQQSERFRKITHISNPEKRLRELAKLLAPIGQCPLEQESVRRGCGRFTPTKVSLRQHKILIEERVDKNKYREYSLSGKEVENIFAKITDEDARLMGFTKSKPVDLLISSLAVAPPQIRPSIEMNPQKRAEDDITLTYARIVALNNEIKECPELSERNSRMLDMEKLIASIMVTVDRMTISSGQVNQGRRKRTHKIKSIEERLKAKEGRFRQHLMGKRVDFSARSVISPDANLALDQLGVPQKIAAALTIPQEVTQWNFERILELCKQGKVKYILRPTIERRRYQNFLHVGKLGNSAEQIEKYLSYGTIVERNLEDGDYVLFNRQPTLHRMSMMAHRVKVLPYNTFRLNLSVCSPYNADFDGDEMNMHVPQSLQTIAELKHIAHVSKQVIAPKNNAPVMGIVQDSLLGIYLLTMRDTFLTREQIMNLIIWIEPTLKLDFGELPMPAIVKPVPMWTGKQVVSLLIPSQISITIFKGKDGFKNKDDTSMVIRRGELISGALQKEVVGSGAGGLVHAIWLQLGADCTGNFITNAQRVANNWLMTSTFSVGAEDVIIDGQLEQRRSIEVDKIKKTYYQIANKYRRVKYVHQENLHQRGYRIADSFEVKINMELNNALSSMQRIITEKVSAHKNNIYKMIVAKSKGSETNLAQIMLCLGNQNVDGRRCPLGFLRRALPHFSKDDNSPQPRGFVFSSFFKGLKPHEFFFHSMGGREGLSDTAVKTSSIGYIQRKLVKSLEDLSIRYDGTVRDSQSNLLQKLYGEDSFLSEFVQRHRSADAETSDISFQAKMKWEKHKLEEMGYNDREIKRINEQYELLKRCRERLRDCYVKGKDSLEIEYFGPIKMERLLTKVLEQTRADKEEGRKSPAGPLLIIETVEQLLQECIIPHTRLEYQQLRQKIDRNNKNRKPYQQFQCDSGIQIFQIHLRLNLASKMLHQQHRLTADQLRMLISQVRSKFKQALAPAGQAVGSVAAQSIGEPTTQMTLNTFHLAGVSERNVTLGIPRLRELLDASKRIKTPMMTIFYHEPLTKAAREKPSYTKLLGELISFDFPERHIRDYLTRTRIYYDPNPQESHIGIPFSYDNQSSSKSPWVLSLCFDKKKLTPQILTEIYKKLDRVYESQFEITEKQGLAGEHPEMILRCLDDFGMQQRTGRNAAIDENSVYKYLSSCELHVKDVFISGIQGLKSVKTAKRTIYRPEPQQDLTKIRREDHEETVFQTTGSNLRACLSHDKIDRRRTYSNDINEVYDVLGIQAARQAFLNEFKEILKPYSIYINHRHLSVLADWMTVRGSLTPINRNGINRVRDVSVLRKASFEQTADVMFGAAVFSEIDELKGVSERIIFGETVKLGTNSFEVILDRERCKNPTYCFETDRVPIAEEANEDEPIQQVNISKTPEGLNTPTMGATFDFRSAYGSPTFPTGKTPIFTPTHEQLFHSPPPPGFSVTSPRYSQGFGMMQSPKYLPTGFNPASRLDETSSFMPAGLNPFDSRRSATPVFISNDRGSEEPNYKSSPSYSPMIQADDKPKKEEEEEN